MNAPPRKRRGYVHKRSGRYWLRIKDRSGKDRRVDLGLISHIRSEVAARREADQWIARNIPELLSTGQQVLATLYFEAFLGRQVLNFRTSSKRRYTSVIRTHLAPAFASHPLHAVDVHACQDFLATMREKGSSRATIAGTRAVLLQILRQARVDGYDTCPIDPYALRLPAMDAAPREQRHIEPGELSRILEAADTRHRALFGLMGYMGLRISEALGLSWNHLDLDPAAPLAKIRQSAQDGRLYPCKTLTSAVDLPIPTELVPLLTAYRAVWEQNTEGLLFATSSGRAERASDLRRRCWLPLLQQLGIQPAGFHALRHGLARRLFAEGLSADLVRKFLRHGSLQMTQRYSHSSAHDLRVALEAARNANKARQARPDIAQPNANSAGISR